MKLTRFVVLLFLASSAAADPLVGRTIINTGPYVCTGAIGPLPETWYNPTGTTIRVHKLVLWTGAQFGTRADLEASVHRLSDGSLLAAFRQDRYSNPAGTESTFVQDFGVNWMDLAPGDGLRLGFFCDSFGKARKAHHTVDLWWSVAP